MLALTFLYALLIAVNVFVIVNVPTTAIWLNYVAIAFIVGLWAYLMIKRESYG